jgi:hypothetical protein
MSDLTYADYRDRVTLMAEMAVEHSEERDQELAEAVFEEVDSSQLVIYTSHHTDVLDHSDEGPQEWNHFVSDGDSWRDVLQAMAFDALRNDVWAAVNELRQEA